MNEDTPTEATQGAQAASTKERAQRLTADRAAKKKHAAARSRLIAAGGAGGATLVMMGVMAAAAQPDVAAPAPQETMTRQVVVVQTPTADGGEILTVLAEPTQIQIQPAPEPATPAPTPVVAQTEGS
jgi:hypothetical protein